MYLVSFCRPAHDSGRNSREDWRDGSLSNLKTHNVLFLMFAPTFQYLNMYFLAAKAPWQCAQDSTVCKLNGSLRLAILITILDGRLIGVTGKDRMIL